MICLLLLTHKHNTKLKIFPDSIVPFDTLEDAKTFIVEQCGEREFVWEKMYGGITTYQYCETYDKFDKEISYKLGKAEKME